MSNEDSKKMNASEFKTHCLALLDEVQRNGLVLTILKRGKPVAMLSPIVGDEEKIPQRALIGSVKVTGDIISSPISPEDIDLESDTL